MPRSVNARRLAPIGPVLLLLRGGVYPQKTDVIEGGKKEEEKWTYGPLPGPVLFLIPRPTKDSYDCCIIFFNDDSHVALAV